MTVRSTARRTRSQRLEFSWCQSSLFLGIFGFVISIGLVSEVRSQGEPDTTPPKRASGDTGAGEGSPKEEGGSTWDRPQSLSPWLKVEDEVRQNILSQPLGAGTAADQGLPDSFVRRIADRILAESYRGQFHRVAGAPDGIPPAGELPEGGWKAEDIDRFQSRTGWTVSVPTAESATTAEFRNGLPAGRIPLRGFRMPLRVESSPESWPFALPAPVDFEHRAALSVQANLAAEGLLKTTAKAISVLNPHEFVSAGRAELETLRSVGIPVDWLSAFDRTSSRGIRILRKIADILITEGEGESLNAYLDSLKFDYRPSHGFRAASESGEVRPGLLRMQVTRADYWGGEGDGGSLSVAEQLLAKLPDVPVVIHLQDRFLDVMADRVEGWDLKRSASTRLEISRRLISQWAQDNGKAGSAGRGDRRVLATLIPRYASRREDAPVLLAHESIALESLRGEGHRIIQSPLLFQGGDSWVVTDPATAQRGIILGEAEIHRNVALGLTAGQVEQVFRADFGVEFSRVLPSVSFHVDYDVNFRQVDGKLVAFVNDTRAALDAIISSGVDAMEEGKVLSTDQARVARESWKNDDQATFFQMVERPLYEAYSLQQAFTFQFAKLFSGGRPETAIGNLSRFMTALELYLSRGLDDSAMNGEGLPGAYLRCCRRRWFYEAELERQLSAWGMEVVRIPSLSNGFQAISAINGVHLEGRYLMPAYGGFYSSLDERAAAAWRKALGPGVEVIPIFCGESQRRQGALHCAVATYPEIQSK